MDSPQDAFLKWLQTPLVGCGFAQHLAKRADEARWKGITILGSELTSNQIVPLNTLLVEMCSNYEVVYIVFPEITSAEGIVVLIKNLCGTPAWSCDEITIDCPQASKALLIGLRWFLPDGRHMNYVLGFARLPQMPRTRRAPYTGLVLRTGPPGRAPGIAYAHNVSAKRDDRASQEPPIPVHLADAADMLPSDERVARFWRSTTKLKKTQLTGDTMAEAAKAKITFCLPLSTRVHLEKVINATVPVTEAGSMS